MRTIQVFHVVSSLDHIGLNRAWQPFLLEIGNSGIVSQQSAPRVPFSLAPTRLRLLLQSDPNIRIEPLFSLYFHSKRAISLIAL